ncbi:hypothetical protein ACFVAV_17900 [Nocardia sp. NPDC057663]|uniref:hypothetical protein n=1 Tax=Nocardia sp. NPDC057663 TaxID=3346201 RepID=UPI0036725546
MQQKFILGHRLLGKQVGQALRDLLTCGPSLLGEHMVVPWRLGDRQSGGGRAGKLICSASSVKNSSLTSMRGIGQRTMRARR